MAGTLKVRDPADPTGATWVSVSAQGADGPTGPTGVQGPPGGGVNVVVQSYGGDQVTSGAANVLTVLAEETVHIKPEAWYQLTAGVRCIADYGAAGLIQLEVGINNVKVPTHSVMSTGADDGLWGSWGRTWIRQGKSFAATEGDYQYVFRASTSVATKVIYSPEIALIMLNDPDAPIMGSGPTGPTGIAGPPGPPTPVQTYAHHFYGPPTSAGATWAPTLKAGTYLCAFQMTAVATATALRYINLLMDGVQVNQSKFYFNQINTHATMNQGVTEVTIPTDGVYTFTMVLSASLSIDVNDFGWCTLTPTLPGGLT